MAQTFARFGADLAVPLSRATSYADAAVARARGWPMRIGFAVFITAASGAIAPDGVGPIWLACVVCAQSIDAWIAAPLRRRPEARPSARRMIVYAASLTLNALIYSAISVDFWFSGSDAGRIFAMLIPAAALLNGALQAEGAPRRLIFTVHATFILGLPMAAGILSPARDLAEMGFVSGAGALIVLHVTMAVRRIQDGARDVRAARDAAQAERRRAEAANAAKSDFLATISHEIRTPLNAVVASAALLRRTELSPLQAEYVEMLANASELLLGLLNDVLDISRIESGKLEVEAAEFDLVAKLEASVRLWRAQTEPKGVTLAFDPAGLPRRIVTDPLRLQQIVFNLLSNAAKFTAAGTIIVRGGRLSGPAGERLWLEVADTGCGMDAATAERVFESFEQAGAATARRHGGAGLGLSISRRLAELLGGGLSVESQAGAGSTFRLETPLLEAPDQALGAPSAAVLAPSGPAGARVLLAEDHEVNQRIVRLILEPLGFRLTVVADGLEAVAACAAEPFDVVLMDMQMPGMGGVEAAALIRGRAGPNRETPILALTANALAEHRAEWAAVGVETFITKPVDMDVLIDCVSRAAAVPA